MTGLSDAATDAVKRARQYGRRVVLNAPAGVAEELLAAGLTDPAWVMDAGGKVAWPLTEPGRMLHDQLTGRDTVTTTRLVDRVLGGPVRPGQD